MNPATLSARSFAAVTDVFHAASGIRLGENKQVLVAGRLQKLAYARGITDVDDYVRQVLGGGDPDEMVRLIDKLTTNETYFFREPEHFAQLQDLIEDHLQHRAPGVFRVWSAASSSGEEAYSIAMLLAERMGLDGWEVVGTDLSTAVVDAAQTGLYPMDRARQVPDDCLRRWCLKGNGAHAGQLLMARELRERVHFLPANLTQTLPEIGQFDVIFLRNVLIYFDERGKTDIVRRVLQHMKPAGTLMTGHAESITSLGLPVQALGPAVYRHAGAPKP